VWWPGAGVGNHRQPYLTVNFLHNPVTDLYQTSHIMDSHVGTHLVPPAYTLPPEELDNNMLAPEVQRWLAAYEKQYGSRGASNITSDKVALSQSCGWLRVIDVRYLVGTTARNNWPRSPEITVEDVKKFEKEHGDLNPNEIVVFESQHSAKCQQPLPGGSVCMADPLNGKSEGWPSPGPDVIFYLAKKGI